jgi:phage FluMu protein Com
MTPGRAYDSWADYLQSTKNEQLRRRCERIAARANRWRSGVPVDRITASDVWTVMEGARGRCSTCGSLAVEGRLSRPDGAPMSWDAVGRRVGRLGHVVPRVRGGPNTPDNLIWQCLWCNTWPLEATPGASDHGGFHPPDDPTVHAGDPFASTTGSVRGTRRVRCDSCQELVNPDELTGAPAVRLCPSCAEVNEDIVWEEPGYGWSAFGYVVALPSDNEAK